MSATNEYFQQTAVDSCLNYISKAKMFVKFVLKEEKLKLCYNDKKSCNNTQEYLHSLCHLPDQLAIVSIVCW